MIGIPERTPCSRPRSPSTERNHGEGSTEFRGKHRHLEVRSNLGDAREPPARDQRLPQLEILLLHGRESRAKAFVGVARIEQRHIVTPGVAGEVERKGDHLLDGGGDVENCTGPTREFALRTARRRTAVYDHRDDGERHQPHRESGYGCSIAKFGHGPTPRAVDRPELRANRHFLEERNFI
jgi:hypothetical protein